MRKDTMDGQSAGAIEMELPLPRPKGSRQFRLVKDFVPPPPRCHHLLPLPRPYSQAQKQIRWADRQGAAKPVNAVPEYRRAQQKIKKLYLYIRMPVL